MKGIRGEGVAGEIRIKGYRASECCTTRAYLVFELPPEGFHELVLGYGFLHAARHLAQDHRAVERLLLAKDERIERPHAIRNFQLRTDRIAAKGFGH